MPMRETIGQTVIEEWKGTNQRIQPTNVPDGFFTFSKGIYFGLGENATRISGKKLSGFINEPVFSINILDKIAILQTLDAVKTCPLSDLLNFTVTP